MESVSIIIKADAKHKVCAKTGAVIRATKRYATCRATLFRLLRCKLQSNVSRITIVRATRRATH